MSTLPKLRPLTRDSAFFVVGATEAFLENMHARLLDGGAGSGADAKACCAAITERIVQHIEWLNKETAENEAKTDAQVRP